MILLRVLLLGGILLFAWMMWRQFRLRGQDTQPEKFEPMLKCCVCQTHIPAHQAHTRNGLHYCDKHIPRAPD